MSTITDESKQFSVGAQWMIKDLTSETGKKFNGKTCVIVSTFDVTTGRVGVQIKNARNKGRTLNIKPINLHADQSTTLMEGVEDTTTQEAEDEEDCPQEAEDKEDCPICCDALPRLSNQFIRYTCCGKGLHYKCNTDLGATKCMTLEQKNTCIMCRTKCNAEGSKEDIEQIRGWVKKGKAWAMVVLAQRYKDGVGLKQSDTKAIELYEMAAKRGQATAQYHLGLYYKQGSHGLTQSSKRAVEYYTLAAEQGHIESQTNLGYMYRDGDGIEQSDKKAIELYEMAAKGGNATAQFNLGIFYDQGMHGLAQSSKTAIEYYTLAAEQGLADAQYNLGLMYARGEGIEQSNSKAREWWTKAAAQGHENAIENLKKLDEMEGLKSTTEPPEVVDANIISCSTCGKQQTKEFRLGKCACRTKRYCNSQCQKKEYKKHKKECLRLVKERKKKKNGQNMKDGTTRDGTKGKAKPLQEEEDKEDCPICCDALPKSSHQFVRLTCCGKGLHFKCNADLMTNTSMTLEQINTCIMCRTKLVDSGSKEEIERLRKWTNKGKAWAMGMLAGMYREGEGVKQSDKKAIELYEMAAKRGNAAAQYNLGIFYDQGSHGLTQSSKRAFEFYALAAEQGSAEAQSNLGLIYAQGKVIETSYSKAREWWTKAAAQGDEDAIKGLKLLDKLGV
jgi:TPR repeat protein